MKGNSGKGPFSKANRSLWFLTILVAGVFAAMAVYFAWFLEAESETVLNNSYNSRLARRPEQVVRGKLFSSDGQILAETIVGEDGEETRSYPYGPVFCHVVGWATKGKTGLEELADFYLLSSHGNLGEEILREFLDQKDPGDDVVTTLDVTLQQTAYAALGDRRGAVVAMEPDTGRILAMVSKPDFDPNQVDELWASLSSGSSGEGVLLNRATQGLYPPGSTFKLVTALEYVGEHPADYEDYHFDCSGVYREGDYSIRCYHGNVHGSQDLRAAFANSCNGAFAHMGLSLNLGRMRSLADQLLFNQELPLALPYSKSSYTMDTGAGTWEILQTAIGQGNTQITPIHSLLLASAVAGDGILMKPYLVEEVKNAAGQVVQTFEPEEYGRLITEAEAAILTDLMTAVVTEGTASALRTDAYQAAGKTGSAEFETGKESHAWFIGFAPAEDPQIAIAVIVEEGGSGGREAAPIARAVFDAYLTRPLGEMATPS